MKYILYMYMFMLFRMSFLFFTLALNTKENNVKRDVFNIKH